MTQAVCDAEAFYPLRSLVTGPFYDVADIAAVERFLRTVVLHDEIVMEFEPLPFDPEQDEFQREANGSMVITALGPTLKGFDFFTHRTGPMHTPNVLLSERLLALAVQTSGAGEGNVYFDAHVKYLRRVLAVPEAGGSALLCGDFGRQAITTARRYPEELFAQLDTDWQRYAKEVEEDGLGLLVPPVLAIVLTRCARRDTIPTVIRELRDEWAGPRARLWALLGALRECRTLARAREIRRELRDAARSFSPESQDDSRPLRMLWEIVGASAAGGATAWLAGGRPTIGALVGAVTQAGRTVPGFLADFGPALFGRGAFDLARRVRRAAANVEHDALRRLLTDAEKLRLGIG